MDMKQWLKITVGPVFWIAAIQIAWTLVLILWITTVAEQRRRVPFEGIGLLVLGVVLLVLMLVGVTVIVIHFARQVAHTRAVKDFISQVSHDLRSPLATVKLHLETIKLRELTTTQKQSCLDAAIHELGRLEDGIEGVLMASRLERDKLKLITEPVGLDEFLRQYAGAKLDDVILRGGSLEIGRLQRLTVRADPLLLRQMLDNLVNNALLHCQHGVKITVSLYEQAGCAVITVLDDGPGLPRNEWKQVFKMFYRAAKSGGHRKGTGLGLFIVAGIAKAHGGRAWVESQGMGSGCEFRVAIPLIRKEDSPS